MGNKTGISWTDATWNPIRGCSRVSEGCRHCYAEQMAGRFSKPGQPYHGLAQLGVRTGHHAKWTGEVRFIAEHLADPLRWSKPRRIFVNSMSDLFHEKLTNEQIAAVFGVMAAAPRHTFQVLTKRAARMHEWFTWLEAQADCQTALLGFLLGEAVKALPSVPPRSRGEAHGPQSTAWPLPNVWLGVSVENQEAADERIPLLLDVVAAVRFLSCEPLLGEVDLLKASPNACSLAEDLDWVIAGCESGRGARPCDVAWLRSLRDQCGGAAVPFFLKQAEESTDCGEDRLLEDIDDESIAFDDGSKMKPRRPGGNHIIELPYLDGVQHAAFPAVPR